jgi:hypothetical protein
MHVRNDVNCGAWEYEIQGNLVARRVRKLSRRSRILFVSQESSADMVREALGTGADGYVVKTDAGSELLEAVNAVLRGEQFVGRSLSGLDFVGTSKFPPRLDNRPCLLVASLVQPVLLFGFSVSNVRFLARFQVHWHILLGIDPGSCRCADTGRSDSSRVPVPRRGRAPAFHLHCVRR